MDLKLVALVPLFPLLGFLFNLFLGRRVPKSVVGGVASAAVLLSFAVSVGAFLGLAALPEGSRSFTVHLFDWIHAGALNIPFAFLLDPLSALYLLIITGVGFLIHVYSTAYMSHDQGFARYFSYLNLFMFSMLVLVLGNGFVTLFVGWEGVGLCSYLLIGFWYEKKSATDAGKKAFIVNRIGDVGFVLGMFLIYWVFGSLTFKDVFAAAAGAPMGNVIVTLICLLLFVGATGKSAQIPLYVWLPDAMEGPTPVSALIHAATMVTAGIYMVARCHVLFSLSPVAMNVVAVVGAATAIFAATIGLVQNDIKRVLAYSTVSQLGYMFLALGVGAYGAAVFHVMTHAFFKALLFLGSGSVIHALSGEQDMQKMGGLSGPLRKTYLTFFIGTLALAGIAPFAGFFSKDEILWHAWNANKVLWGIGLAGAFCTAFYMFRCVHLTFHGQSRLDAHAKSHLHESPNAMLIPLYLLAVLSVAGGWVGLPLMKGGNPLTHWLEPVFGAAHEGAGAGGHSPEITLMVVSLGVALAGIWLATVFYGKKSGLPEKLGARFKGLHAALWNKYYVDEGYAAVVTGPYVSLSRSLWSFFDVKVVDGIVNATGRVVRGAGGGLRGLQSGFVGGYALAMALGLVIGLGWFLLR